MNDMKERLRDALETFFISVTLINIAMLVLGLLLRPTQTFGYEVFVYPILYGLVGAIPPLLINVDRELSVRQVIIRKFFQMLLICVLLIAFIFGGSPMTRETVITAAYVAVSVVLIYIAVNVISWFLDLKAAEKMTADLRTFQEKNLETKEPEIP